jgi:pimeloyl-ACP methyl ester carboxylesterase
VVLESGIAASSLNWRALQTEIAKFTRVVSYDSAGLGWSDLAPGALTLDSLVEDLRALLRAGEVTPPYVLVGHSFGGLIIRAFVQQYPAETSGLILLDAVRTADWSPLSDEKRRTLARGVALSRRGATLARMGIVGWCLRSLIKGSRRLPKVVGGVASGRGLTVMRRIGGEVAKMPPEVWPLIVDHWSQPKSFLGMAAHLESLPEAARAIAGVPAPAGVPVVDFTLPGAPATCAGARNIVAAKSGHWIHLDEPELVIAAIRELMER